MKTLALLLALLALAGCATRTTAPRPLRTSGFLDDYTLLRESAPGDVRHVYRSLDASWASYSNVLLEPVTIWRSGRKSLEPMPKEDLLRLVEDFQAAVRARPERGFRFVMFLSMHRSISRWTSGSTQVWQKVARFCRELPSSSSSSCTSW